MSQPQTPEKGALVIALMISDGFDKRPAMDLMEKEFGPIELKSDQYPFEFTSYYEKEMGPDIRRMFVLFNKLSDQGELADFKLKTNEIEKKYLEGESRQINIDPGILLAGSFILATGKQAPHRIYLRDGIYGELTLKYESGQFCPQSWTYPDYRDSRTTDFLQSARKYYLQARKATERSLSTPSEP